MQRTGTLHATAKEWARGMTLAFDGATPEGAARVVGAADTMRGIGMHFLEAQMLLDAVRLLPDDTAAPVWAARAREIFERLKARPFLAMLDQAESEGRPARRTAPQSRAVDTAVARE